MGRRICAQPFCSGGVRRIGVNPFVVAFGPFLPARMVHEVSPSLVVKHDDAAEVRVVVAAAVIAFAADAMLVAQHLLKIGSHVQNLALRSSLEAGSTREKKGGE